MKQYNIDGVLVFLSDEEYYEIEKQKTILEEVEMKGWKNEIQKKTRIKITTKRFEKSKKTRSESEGKS